MFFYNGTDFRDLIIVENIERPVLSSTENKLNPYIVFNGSDFISSRRQEAKFKITFSYVQENLNTIRRVLAQFLGTEELSELYFYDDPEIIYYAKVDGEIKSSEYKANNYTKGYGNCLLYTSDAADDIL